MAVSPASDAALPRFRGGAAAVPAGRSVFAVEPGPFAGVFAGALPAAAAALLAPFGGAVLAPFAGVLPAAFAGALPAGFDGALLPAAFAGVLPAVFAGALPAVFAGVLPADFAGALPAALAGAFPAAFAALAGAFPLAGVPADFAGVLDPFAGAFAALPGLFAVLDVDFAGAAFFPAVFAGVPFVMPPVLPPADFVAAAPLRAPFFAGPPPRTASLPAPAFFAGDLPAGPFAAVFPAAPFFAGADFAGVFATALPPVFFGAGRPGAAFFDVPAAPFAGAAFFAPPLAPLFAPPADFRAAVAGFTDAVRGPALSAERTPADALTPADDSFTATLLVEGPRRLSVAVRFFDCPAAPAFDFAFEAMRTSWCAGVALAVGCSRLTPGEGQERPAPSKAAYPRIRTRRRVHQPRVAWG